MKISIREPLQRCTIGLYVHCCCKPLKHSFISILQITFWVRISKDVLWCVELRRHKYAVFWSPNEYFHLHNWPLCLLCCRLKTSAMFFNLMIVYRFCQIMIIVWKMNKKCHSSQFNFYFILLTFLHHLSTIQVIHQHTLYRGHTHLTNAHLQCVWTEVDMFLLVGLIYYFCPHSCVFAGVLKSERKGIDSATLKLTWGWQTEDARAAGGTNRVPKGRKSSKWTSTYFWL